MEDSVTFKVHVVGVAGSSGEPRPVTSPLDATLQDVLDKLIEEKVVSVAPKGQEWTFKLGSVVQQEESTLRQIGIKDNDNLKLVLDQEFAR